MFIPWLAKSYFIFILLIQEKYLYLILILKFVLLSISVFILFSFLIKCKKDDVICRIITVFKF